MNFEKMSNMATKQLMRGIGLTMLMVVLSSSPCYADEIVFKDQGAQTGMVLEEDEQTTTIRFPKESIKSIIKDQKAASSGEKTQDLDSVSTESQLQERMEQLQERMERLEKKLKEEKKSGGSPTPHSPSKNGKAMEQLLRDEMGHVKGVILWKGKPMANGSVTIVLERYTGFSLASLKKLFSGDKEDPSDQKITLTTHTDSQGQYIFEEAPPGKYRLYLKPNPEADWVRRLAEKPDFEVLAGQVIIYNIPGKKK
jgi:DNA-binding transcriptional MerR regulator